MRWTILGPSHLRGRSWSKLRSLLHMGLLIKKGQDTWRSKRMNFHSFAYLFCGQMRSRRANKLVAIEQPHAGSSKVWESRTNFSSTQGRPKLTTERAWSSVCFSYKPLRPTTGIVDFLEYSTGMTFCRLRPKIAIARGPHSKLRFPGAITFVLLHVTTGIAGTQQTRDRRITITTSS